MLIKTIFIFVTLLCAVYLGIYLHDESGYVVLVLKNYTIETSIWIVILGFILINVSLYVIFIIINKLLNIPKDLTNWKKLINLHNSQQKTRQGLIEFNEGHWQLAKKHLIDALPNAEAPLLNYLTAARAAQEMGENTQRDNFLRQAQKSMPEAKIAVELTQAQLQIANKQWEQALATLKHLQTLSPKHPYVLKLLCELYEEIKDWQQLINLLPIIKSNKVIAKEIFLEKQQNAYYHELRSLIKQKNEIIITAFIQKIPKEIKSDVYINCLYIEYLLTINKDKQAEDLLHKLLQKQPNIYLLITYTKLNADVINIRFIESLEINNKVAIFKYCLGKICITKKLWGKAQVYLEESIQTNPCREAYQALGMLFEHENKLEQALEAYRNGLNIESYKSQLE